MDISPILSNMLSRTPPVWVTERKRRAMAPSSAAKYPDRTSETTAANHNTIGDSPAAYNADVRTAKMKLRKVIELGEPPPFLKTPAPHRKNSAPRTWTLARMTQARRSQL